MQAALIVVMRLKRDGMACFLEWRRVAQWQRYCKGVLQKAVGRLQNRSAPGLRKPRAILQLDYFKGVPAAQGRLV